MEKITINTEEITRIEIINHAKNNHPIGRLITLYKSRGDFDIAEISMQDDNKTLKIFLSQTPKENI